MKKGKRISGKGAERNEKGAFLVASLLSVVSCLDLAGASSAWAHDFLLIYQFDLFFGK